MKRYDWSELKKVKQYRYIPKPIEYSRIIGWDTETVKGKIWLIANSDKQYAFIKNFTDLVSFLFRHSYRSTLNYFWNLDFDARAMIKLLGEDDWEALYFKGWVEHDGYKIRYIPKKLFSISKHKHTVSWYDLYQFFNCSLEQAAVKYLNKHKIPLDISKIDDAKWRNTNKALIVDYCINDAILCQQLGVIFERIMNNSGIKVVKPLSSASLSIRYASSKTVMPRCFFKEYDEYAFKAYHGGRFEVLQRGYFPKAFCYDINSAYPSQIAKLADLCYGYWVKSKDIPADAHYGFIRCKVSCDQDWLSPLPVFNKPILIFPRTKQYECYLTLEELKYIEKHNLCNIDIIDGWFWIPHAIFQPFSYIKELYEERQRLKHEKNPLELGYKIMLNSLYGKFMETRPYLVQTKIKDPEIIWSEVKNNKPVWYKYAYRTGNWFNPVYAAVITANTRLQCYELARKLKKDVIAIFTDAIYSKKDLGLHSNKLGEWNFINKGELVLIGSGIYCLKNDSDIITKFRGFKFSKNLDLFKELTKVKNSTRMTFLLPQVITLGKILFHTKKLTPSQLNQFETIVKELNVNFDKKRQWLGSFHSCADVLTTQHESQTLIL